MMTIFSQPLCLYRESLALPREELDTIYTARHTGPSVSGPFPW